MTGPLQPSRAGWESGQRASWVQRQVPSIAEQLCRLQAEKWKRPELPSLIELCLVVPTAASLAPAQREAVALVA